MSRTSSTHRSHLPGVDTALIEELECAVPGGVRVRASDRLAHAHDASHYLLTPRAVVVPESATQIAALLRGATRHRVPLTFRSGGTSLSGQASTDGILIDTRRNFRAVDVFDGGEHVRTQPGATVRQVNARLAMHKRKLGPDPASEAACTIGGVIANNSSGMACGTEFNSYRTIESAVVVLPSGTMIDTSHPDADDYLREREPALHAGLLALRADLLANATDVERIRRMYSIKNTMGYGLNSFLDFERAVDILLHLVVGSEGTLAFIAEATFRTVPVKPHTATDLLYFPSLSAATASLPALVAAGFATIELLDATSLRVAQRDPEADETLRSIHVDGHAALLVEFQEADKVALARRMESAADLLRSLPLVRPAALSSDAVQRAAFWHIRKGLYATVAGNRPSGTTALLEDIAVPVENLLPTCEGLVALFERFGYEDSVIFGHAKDGNIHFLLNEHFDPASGQSTLDRYAAFTEEMVNLVLSNGGTLKAEHGTGRIMAPFVSRQYGESLYGVMREIKRLCDPLGLLNPGILLNDDAASHMAHLKTSPTVEPEVDRCVECGYCEPVCPSKDLTLTPRQRIVLRREIARAEQAGDTALKAELENEYRYDGVETCAVDGMCQTACPVLIDTGQLVKRLRAESSNGIESAGWKAAAGNWGSVAQVGGLTLSAIKRLPAPLVTAASEAGRRLAGPDRVPRWDKDLPAGGIRRQPLRASEPKAVYLAACINTMFGPAADGRGVSSAFLALCERAGISVAIPDGIGDMCCGTPWKSKGMTAGYERMRDKVLPAVWEASRHGELPILCDAASCTEGLETLLTIVSDESRLRIVDAVAFVDEHVLPALPPGKKIGSLALHPTCSSTRMGLNAALGRVAAAVAEEVVIPEDWGCCAFAGDRGMLHPELTASATAREARSINGRNFDAYASLNRTCELGMTRATGHPYQHILELLASVTSPTEVPVTKTAAARRITS
ncbi:FAD-binding and (Fe-S)-binding domain-containing protein [Arthrobacter rhizosphaerae]|uniref:FAD-binding and (Fe-S)-binding domain-containing protein n=1 Tax=Arthrobacter rhizosphaerae TaxID=2855490 RepID=UPI001FF15076|nr:FAD-binding and (Fe-S)-binding domain-containing protein [Arthrobacter rhizosphaerae]